MKKVILASLIIGVGLMALIVIDKTLVSRSGFGGLARIVVGILSVWAIFCVGSLVAYTKGFGRLVTRLWASMLLTAGLFLTVDLLLGVLLIVRLSPRITADAFVHHRLEPNTLSDFATPEYRYLQRVNNLGLRGADVETRKRPGTVRILMLGDSFTMGKGVADEKTFSALLERSLNAKRPWAGKAIQVLNGGVDSYAPVLSRIQLTRLAPVLEPDLVVHNFDMSDLLQEVAYRRAATVGADGEIVGVNGLRPGDEDEILSGHAVSSWIDHHMFGTRLLLYLVKTAIRKADEYTINDTVQTANPDLLKHTLASDTVDRTDQWALVFDSILETKRYCDERRIKYMLTVYPWGHQVNDREWGPGRTFLIPAGSVISDSSRERLKAFAVENGIITLDLFPAFRNYSGSDRLYFDYDQHWTEAGHQMMAHHLDQFIQASYFSKPE